MLLGIAENKVGTVSRVVMESQDQKGAHSHPVRSLRYTNRDPEAQGREMICTKSPWEKRLGEEQQGENMGGRGQV